MSERAPGAVPAELLEPLRAQPARSAVLCDIDGTLAPIAAEPGGAAVPEEARAALRKLAARYALVGCVSGRRAAQARRMVAVDGLVYVGNHGFESLGPGEESPSVDPRVSARSDLVSEFLAGVDPALVDGAGLRLEDKGSIKSLHWRGAPEESEAERRANELAGLAAASGVEPRWGRKVLELRPVAGIDKGSATELMLAERGIARALFGGDDVTDLDAFDALRRMRSDGRLEHAVCVGVASDEEPPELAERSDVVVLGPPGFLELLSALL